MIGGRRPLQGRKIGDRRVRVDRPHSPYFRYTGAGMLTAKEAATAPRTGVALIWSNLRRSLFGRPLSNEEEALERLPKKLALPIFSSDAISSAAYAPDEILIALFAGGMLALEYSVEVALAIALMLAVVSTSYRQVCRAYPSGGGAYAVAKENLGPIFGLIAAGALMIDYVMTVAVSTASAVAQAYSVWPGLYDIRIEIGIASIALITIGNLRGLRESGNIFALPTYLFVGLALLTIGMGLARAMTGQLPVAPIPAQVPPPGTEVLSIFLLLRAFAGGSVALTGVEAIANGVPAFKPPESKNAANTMTMMAILLGVLFVGFMFLADTMGFRPAVIGGGPTAIAQLGTAIFGDGSPLFVSLQIATALILFLAVNTSFNAFPRLAAILAGDGYMPRQFGFRGDRLAYSYGIVILAGVAGLLLIVFQGDTHLLIPLYSVGVFVCFTLSQIGMVRHWIVDHGSGWRWRAVVNAFGGLLTLVVLIVVVSVKFAGGAWLVVVLVPLLVGLMLFIHRQYATSTRALALRPDQVVAPPHREERVVVPISGLSRAVVQAVNVGRSISPDVRAVLVVDDHAYAEQVRDEWARQVPGVSLVIVESPYRALTGPFLAYLDVLDQAWTPDKDAPITFVVIPEYVPRHWWERILYNQSTSQLRRALLGRPNTVITNVPYRGEEPAVFERRGRLDPHTPPDSSGD
ncbi:MAG TPA: APC family permease [Candidatus Limnocylindrales bacterium]|jgi:amino acid transporter